MHLTNKQRKIIKAVVEGNPDGTPLNVSELSDALDYHPSKQSLQFSIRAMIGHNLIRKEEYKVLDKHRYHQRIVPTAYGKMIYESLYSHSSEPMTLSTEDIDLDEEII